MEDKHNNLSLFPDHLADLKKSGLSNVLFDKIPGDLKNIPQWLTWGWRKQKVEEKLTKPPIDALTGKLIDKTNPQNWLTFEEAQKRLKNCVNGSLAGIGLYLNGNGLVAVDLDDCVDKGVINPWAEGILKRLNSYSEITPSQTGLRVWAKSSLEITGRKKKSQDHKKDIEIYVKGGYLTVTGFHVEGTPVTVEWRDKEIESLFDEVFGGSKKPTQEQPVLSSSHCELTDQEIIERAKAARNGTKFKRLWSGDTSGYPSPSEAELALCVILSFWTGRDATAIDRLFRQSGLMREKWDREDYARRTIQEAIQQTVEAYTPSKKNSEEEWPDPIPLDEYSSLPDFPIEALVGPGREMVEAVSEVNQVDAALTASAYLAVLSSSCSRKGKVDLQSHKEPLNLYLCPVSDSGTRKSTTIGEMTKPLYEFEKAQYEEMKNAILDAQNIFRIKEKRLEKLQKRAAEEEDPSQRRQFEREAGELARDMAENPVPKSPVFLIDDVTPEKLGVVMAENNERVAAIHPEGNLFEIMAGRYSKDGIGNIDIFLKGHAGDPWSNHRIGREAQAMQAPALTLCLAVQSEVVEEAGKNNHFRGKGLLARILYSRCKSQVGYRKRQKNPIPAALIERYEDHVFSLMEMPFTENEMRMSQDAQALWDEFYNDIEKEMRPGESLCYLPDWGSKLPGAVARIAGLLHLAEHGAKGLSMTISVSSVSASCVIGAYFKEHALAVFGLMREEKRIKLARQILEYIQRDRPETFQGRDVMRRTSIALMDEVQEGLKILLDRGFIREEQTDREKSMGRPKAPGYRVHPAIIDAKNVGEPLTKLTKLPEQEAFVNIVSAPGVFLR